MKTIKLFESFRKKEVLPLPTIEQNGLKHYIGSFTMNSDGVITSNLDAGEDVRPAHFNFAPRSGSIEINDMDINALRRILGLERDNL